METFNPVLARVKLKEENFSPLQPSPTLIIALNRTREIISRRMEGQDITSPINTNTEQSLTFKHEISTRTQRNLAFLLEAILQNEENEGLMLKNIWPIIFKSEKTVQQIRAAFGKGKLMTAKRVIQEGHIILPSKIYLSDALSIIENCQRGVKKHNLLPQDKRIIQATEGIDLQQIIQSLPKITPTRMVTAANVQLLTL